MIASAVKLEVRAQVSILEFTDLFLSANCCLKAQPMRWAFYLLPQKYVLLNIGLFLNCTQCAFGHVAGVIRDGGITRCGGVKPNLVAARRLAMKFEPQLL